MTLPQAVERVNVLPTLTHFPPVRPVLISPTPLGTRAAQTPCQTNGRSLFDRILRKMISPAAETTH
jgi:hypothetical protein